MNENHIGISGCCDLRMGDGPRITPDHGSEERRRMLKAAYYRDMERYKMAKERQDSVGICRYWGSARRFRQLLHQEYGEEIDGTGIEDRLLPIL